MGKTKKGVPLGSDTPYWFIYIAYPLMTLVDLGSSTTDTTANGWIGWSWSSYTSPFGF